MSALRVDHGCDGFMLGALGESRNILVLCGGVVMCKQARERAQRVLLHASAVL